MKFFLVLILALTFSGAPFSSVAAKTHKVHVIKKSDKVVSKKSKKTAAKKSKKVGGKKLKEKKDKVKKEAEKKVEEKSAAEAITPPVVAVEKTRIIR